MLFYIDKTIGEAFSAGTIKPKELALFEDLAAALRKGQCIVCGDIKSLLALSKLPNVAGAVFQKLVTKYVEQKAIIEKVSTVFCISMTSGEGLPPFLAGKAAIIKVCNITDNNWEITSLGNLLCENLTDCKFYYLFGENYRHVQNISEYRIQLNYHNGGGDTTSSVFRNLLLREHKATLCIVDSDHKYGNGCPLGDTAASVQALVSSISIPCPPWSVIIIPIHEAENLIPLDIIAQVYPREDFSARRELINSLSQIDNANPVFFYDFKNGMHSFDVSNDFGKYWTQVSQKDGVDLSPFDGNFPSITKRKCLEKATNVINESIVEKGEQLSFPSYLQSTAEMIGKAIFTWGCAS